MQKTTLLVAILSAASFAGIQGSKAAYTITCPDKLNIGQDEVSGDAVISTGGTIQVKTFSMEQNPNDITRVKLDQALVKGYLASGNTLMCRYITWRGEKVGQTYELIASLGQRNCMQATTLKFESYVECE